MGGGEFEDRAVFGKTVTLIATRSNLKIAFDEMIVAKNNLIRDTALQADVPASIVNSGWELYSHNANQAAFLDYTRNNRVGHHAVMDAINTFGGLARLANMDVKIPLVIRLENGAEIIVVVRFIKTYSDGRVVPHYEIDFRNSRDENRNPLIIQPTGTPNVGPYGFRNGSRSQYEFLQAVTRTQHRYFIGGGGGHSTTCRIVKDNGGETRVICVISN